MARNKHPEETVNFILDVAFRLFMEKGYEPVFNTCESIKRRYSLILLRLRLFDCDYRCCMERLL